MPKADETPGKGVYKCIDDGQHVVLEKNSDPLPRCPKCGGTRFIKVG